MPTPSANMPAFLAERQELLARYLDGVAPRCDLAPFDVHRSIRYTLLGRSKRVRGVLTLLVADLLASPMDATPAAAAIEMVHASSLILDDLPAMDDTRLRRGRPANHVEFGEATAILAAVELLTLAFGHVATAYAPPIAATLARLLADTIGCEGLVGGQAADLLLPAHPLPVSQIEPVDERKTAVLFRAASAAGAIVGGADARTRELLADFGDRIGLAFQIVDDILDTTDGGEAPGRSRGHAASIADVSVAKQRAEELCDLAIQRLEEFGNRGAKLRELARFVVERTE